MRHVCLAVAVGFALLAGCSKKPVIEECFDEFVQEFELTTPGWTRPDSLCKGQDAGLPYPEAYRDRFSSVVMEYSEGDYYIIQTDRTWKLELGEPGEGDERFCKTPVPQELIITVRFEDGEMEREALINGDPTAPVGTIMENRLFGRDRLTNQGWQDSGVEDDEETEFKLRCAMTERTVVTNLKTPACMPVEPVRQCASVREMLPIRQEGLVQFGKVTGKTIRLEMGKVGTLVDKSTWVLESDDAE
jgi:hypothetical protein